MGMLRRMAHGLDDVPAVDWLECEHVVDLLECEHVVDVLLSIGMMRHPSIVDGLHYTGV